MYSKTQNITTQGNHKITYAAMPVNRDSFVLASACELILIDGLYRPWIGAAIIQVFNVCPQDNGNVDFILSVGWESDLPCRVTLVVIPTEPHA